MLIRRPFVSIVAGVGMAYLISSTPGCGTNTNSAGTGGIVTDQGKAEANKASEDFYKTNKLNKRPKR